MAKAIVLPDIPGAGGELEDYIAALFQASGHYVEKQVIEADPLDLLELDIVATAYSLGAAKKLLVEVKGGKWGYSDLFKVVGWMKYLNIDTGAFFVKDWLDLTGADDRMKPLGLAVTCYDNFAEATTQFSDEGFGSFADPNLIELWRHSYNLERALTRAIFDAAKGPGEAGKSAKTYYKLINHGTFFSRTPAESIAKLYTAYMEHPKLTLASALEIDGGTFDAHTPTVPSDAYKEAMYEGKQPLVQACMYLEQRARLSILKAAIDYALGHPGGPPAPGKLDFDELDFHMLPNSFKDGLTWLMSQPNYTLYAVFWQQFLWGWGGFYLDDRESDEFEWMAKYSGIPAGEIPTALEAFDKFFPITGGWFVTPGQTCVRMLKMVPLLFQGIGAHHRRAQYEMKDLADLKSSGYTQSDLAKRINCTVNFLTPD